MTPLLRALGARWKLVAHAIGNVQARLILSVFYFVAVPPFAAIVKAFKDPLQLHPTGRASGWIERPAPDAFDARRQF